MSPPRRPRPIRKVQLKITIEADDSTIDGLKRLEGVIATQRKASLKIVTDTPEEALEQVKRLSEALSHSSKQV